MSRRIKDDWIREYLRFTENHESPVVFNVWIALSIIATAMERRIYLDFGHYKIYPNMFVILVSDPGICKKSASIGIGAGILEGLKKSPKQFSQKGSPEALIKAMQTGAEAPSNSTLIHLQPASMFVKASELSAFLGKTSYESGLLALLTDLYDCPNSWSYETISKGKQELNDVYINLLGGTTPSWMSQSIPGDAVGGGFLSRTILVFSNTPKKEVPWPELDSSLERVKENLIHDLEHIRTLKGAVIATKQAKEWYSAWYSKEMEYMKKFNQHGELLARRPTHMLKVAMAISVAQRDDLIIDVSHFEAAEAILDAVKRSVGSAVEGLEGTPGSDAAIKVLKVIQRHRKISHKQLQKTVWRYAQAEPLAAILDTLDSAGIIRIVDGAERWYEFLGDENAEVILAEFKSLE